MSVVVVGGGLAGITAALALHDAGVPVTLLEANERLGGRATTTRVGGRSLELGPQSFSGRREAVWRLLARLDLTAERLGGAAKTRFVVRGGKMRALRSPLSLWRLLSFTEIVRLLAEPWIGKATKEESVSEFFARRLGKSAGPFLAEAMVTGIFAGEPTELSLDGCFAAFATWEKNHGSLFRGLRRAKKTGQPGTFAVKGGFASIAARTREILGSRVRLNTPVFRVSCNEVTLGGGEVLAADAVILACDPRQSATLVSGPLAAVLGEFHSAPISVVHFTGAEKAPRGFGFIAPASEGAFCLGVVFSGDIHGTERYFTALVGGTRHAHRAMLSELLLREGINADLARFGFGQIENVLHVQRWTQAVCQPLLGHTERVARAHGAAAEAGLALAGAYLGSAAMHDAIASGEAAAARVLVEVPKILEHAS